MFETKNAPVASSATPGPEQPPTLTIDPRRMMWAGLLVDSANLIGGGQMQGLAGQWASQAMMHNHQQEVEALARERQARLDAEEQRYRQQQLSNQLLTTDIKNYNAAMAGGFAGTFEDWVRLQKNTSGEGSIGKINPGLYTPDSVQRFEQTGDYSVLQRRPLEPTAEMRNYAEWEKQNPGKTLDEYYESKAFQSAYGKGLGGAVGAAEGELEASAILLAGDGLPMLHQQLTNVQDLAAAIESGMYNETGPFEGLFKRYGNQATAELEARNIYQTLLNLEITNLAPVTENELALVRSLFADINRDPAANLGRLKEAARVLRDKIDLAKEKIANSSAASSIHQKWIDNGWYDDDEDDGWGEPTEIQ